MKNICCVCGNRAEGLICYGEFVCYTCHEEATGERPEPKSFDGKLAASLMVRRFRITYEFAGFVSAYIVSASSKYSAKQKFYVEYPRAMIIKIEAEEQEYDEE